MCANASEMLDELDCAELFQMTLHDERAVEESLTGLAERVISAESVHEGDVPRRRSPQALGNY